MCKLQGLEINGVHAILEGSSQELCHMHTNTALPQITVSLESTPSPLGLISYFCKVYVSASQSSQLIIDEYWPQSVQDMTTALRTWPITKKSSNVSDLEKYCNSQLPSLWDLIDKSTTGGKSLSGCLKSSPRL